MADLCSEFSVLIVEDDPEIRDSLQDVLEMEGYVAYTASNGKEALELLSRIKLPCLILLDLMMPVMNGWEFLKQHKQSRAFAGVPVVIVTATPEERARPPQAQGLIKKPVDLDCLLKVVQLYCREMAA